MNKHFYSIDILRGCVAMAVCFYHFAFGFLPSDHWFTQMNARSYLGVQIFFVISGIVIPYAMLTNNYSIKNVPTFMAKRLLRIEPPYWVSIALIFFVDWLSSFFRYYKDKTLVFDPEDILTHVLHLNDLMDRPWMKAIYWSLAIEVQYYILIALLLPVFFHANKKIAYTAMFVFCMGKWTNMDSIVLYYGCHFTIGFILCNKLLGRIDDKEFKISMAITLAITFWCFDVYHIIALTLAGLVLFYLTSNIKPLVFLGKISYSFYLIHIPVGWTLIDAYQRSTAYKADAFISIWVGVISALLASAIFYFLVEKPSIFLSKLPKYR